MKFYNNTGEKVYNFGLKYTILTILIQNYVKPKKCTFLEQCNKTQKPALLKHRCPIPINLQERALLNKSNKTPKPTHLPCQGQKLGSSHL